MTLRRGSRKRRIQELVASVPYWYHSIDLGDGVVTPGARSLRSLREQAEALRFPDLTGKTFLDIGAWDGFFSFEAEQRGARRVLALDHYVWSGTPRPLKDVRAEDLPDKRRGFEVAREARGSAAECRVGDFMTMDLKTIGVFDVVLFAGVLYHLKNPFEAVERLAYVTREVAIIETQAVLASGLEDCCLFEFYEADELLGDATNWWAPNARALEGMCRAAGFSRVEILGYPGQHAAEDVGLRRYRFAAHAFA